MPNAKFIVLPDGLEAQFRLIPDDDEQEEGQIDDEDEDDEEDDDDDENAKQNCEDEAQESDANGKDSNGENGTKTKAKKQPRISLFEMQSFLVALLIPEPRLSTPPTWCRVLRCMRAPNVGIFLLDNVDLDWIENKGSKFQYGFRFECSPSWIQKLTSVPLSRRLQDMTMPADLGAVDGKFESNLNAMPKIPKTSLLLSPIQMLVEGYPMPYDEDIRILGSKFREVDANSPLFAIDCEMCITDKSELTKISIVDEELRVVYNELVIPDKPITNYLTRYSGITKEMMSDVTIKLKDVQSFIRKNLPRDAIYCGHSLNMDLQAIKIFHPYIIDTSVIYNRTGIRSYKPSLKSLAYELLGKEIQTHTKVGHDSLEDALTTMELVKLKLVNGLLFGDSVAFEQSQGIKYDSETGTTLLQIDKFIDRHKISTMSYRFVDTTPGARCFYVHDKQEPLDQVVKDAISNLLEKNAAICVILTNSGECYVKF